MQSNRENHIARDEELIALVVESDHNAFRDLFYAYNRSVVQFLAVMTGSTEAAEDISQDIFAYIWENRQKLTGVRNFKSYLYTVARNASFKHIRQNRNIYGLTDETHMGDEAAAHASDEILMAEETRLLIKIAVNRMPKLRRTVFTMSRLDGLTNDQIAKKLGISNESVASHINTAKKEIKKFITVYLLLFHWVH